MTLTINDRLIRSQYLTVPTGTVGDIVLPTEEFMHLFQRQIVYYRVAWDFTVSFRIVNGSVDISSDSVDATLGGLLMIGLPLVDSRLVLRFEVASLQPTNFLILIHTGYDPAAVILGYA